MQVHQAGDYLQGGGMRLRRGTERMTRRPCLDPESASISSCLTHVSHSVGIADTTAGGRLHSLLLMQGCAQRHRLVCRHAQWIAAESTSLLPAMHVDYHHAMSLHLC